MSLTLFPQTEHAVPKGPARPRLGRPPAGENHDTRRTRLYAVGVYLLASRHGLTLADVAKAFRVNLRTLKRWKAEILAEDGPEVDALRQMAALVDPDGGRLP